MTAAPQLNAAKINQLADAVTDLPFYNFRMNTWPWAPRPMPNIMPNPDDPVQTALAYSAAGCVAGWVAIALHPEVEPLQGLRGLLSPRPYY